MYKRITLLLILCSFLLLVSCNNSKSDSVKNSNSSILSGSETFSTDEAGTTKNGSSSTLLVTNDTQNSDFAKAQLKTIELEKSIKEKPTLLEQLQLSFHELNRKDVIDKNIGYDMVGFQNFTMKIFEDFLSSEQSYAMSKSDYNKLSETINVFPLKNGRVFTYCGSSMLFGDSGKTDFVYFQTKVDDKIKVSVLYENVFRDISNVIQPIEDKNLIVLTGNSRDGKPWKAFVDGFYVNNGTASKVKILENYNDSFWCVDSKEDTIYLLQSSLAETYINKTSDRSIEIAAGDAKIILSFNIKSLRYSVQKN